MRVAILGCGPSGLLAAHAYYQHSNRLADIYSVKWKAVLPGTMYVHDAIPGLLSSARSIEYRKSGDRAGYAEKVYGSPDAPCSWDLFPEGPRAAWSMYEIYDQLWDRFENRIIEERILPGHISGLMYDYDMVISTIPVLDLCMDEEHSFSYRKIYVLDSSIRELPEGVIWYNGEKSDHWYRSSNIFGHESTESTTSMLGAVVGTKPLSTDCDCHRGLIRAGRFGQWKKGVLVDHVYRETIERLKEYNALH